MPEYQIAKMRGRKSRECQNAKVRKYRNARMPECHMAKVQKIDNTNVPECPSARERLCLCVCVIHAPNIKHQTQRTRQRVPDLWTRRRTLTTKRHTQGTGHQTLGITKVMIKTWSNLRFVSVVVCKKNLHMGISGRIILSRLNSNSIGILSVVYRPVIISVHGVCYLARFMRVGCTWLFYPS